MENPKPPEPRTRRACKDKAEAEKLEEQRILDEFPWVLMVGRNEEPRQRKVDKVNCERRRELDAIERRLDAIERGEAIIKKEVVDEEEREAGREQELNNNTQVQSNEVGVGQGDVDVKEEVVEEREQELNNNIQVQSNEVGAGEGDIDVKEEVVEGEEEVEANLNGNRGE